MKRYFLQHRAFRMLLGLALLVCIFFIASEQSNAQLKPQIPILSLTGADNGYDVSWYPDGRIWLPQSNGEPREFLLPVWVNNRWYTYPQLPKYKCDPIRSFQFRILYDSTALRAVGIQKFGPRDADNGYDPLAKNFNIEWYDERDTNYREYLNPLASYQDKQKGRTIRILGTSTTDVLPHTDLNSEEFKILLYVRFRVVPNAGQIGGGVSSAGNTPIYIGSDTIKYNDLNVRTHAPFENLRKIDPIQVITDYPNPGQFTGLAGMWNFDAVQYAYEPTKPGSIYLRISDQLPEFGFALDRGVGQQPGVRSLAPDLVDVLDPITVDSASQNPQWGTRRFRFFNNTNQTRMLDIHIETDQPWLKLWARRVGANDKVPPDFSRPERSGNINWLDNGILGTSVGQDPFGKDTKAEGDVLFEIQCDPSNLETESPEKTGVYVGYVTFRSSTAGINPVRLRVTFIYFRIPVEGGLGGRKPGIEITVRNSKGANGQINTLIFGTGHRATNSYDTLYGEYKYSAALGQLYPGKPDTLDARWFPLDPAVAQDVPFGFGDWTPNDEDNPPSTPQRSHSRDIRSNTDTLRSILYLCKFYAGGAQYYPINVEWDVSDFPEGSQLFLRDAVNGTFFNVNMREATPLGGTKFSYAIQDPKYTSFIIEYTLPRIIQYIDAYGNPIIQHGWNLLSLPVRPTNNVWNIFYPNAVNIPFAFTLNQYQQAENLLPGVGYFIKYPDDIVDKTFKGTFIADISKDLGTPVRLYTGWNTIGSCSAPVNVRDIDFDPFIQNEFPDKNETYKRGIYGYVTNRGYIEVSDINPGLGYWIYVDKGAYLKMSVPIQPKTIDVDYADSKKDVLASSSKLTIRDNSQNEGNLYMSNNSKIDLASFSLPPLPPFGMFDVRFATNAYLNNNESSVIKLQGITYPIALGMEKADANYTFVDAVSGEVYGSITKGNAGNVTIKNTKADAIKVLKENAASSGFGISNYPNPVATTSTIDYSVIENGNVTIKLYDALGNEVRTLLNDYRTAGSYADIRLNAAGLAEGTYMCKIISGSSSAVRTITVVK